MGHFFASVFAERFGRYAVGLLKQLVEGSLQIRSYQAQDGTNRRVAEVVADNVRFLSPKDGGAMNSPAAYQQSPVREESPFVGGMDDQMVGNDDLPF